MFEFKGVKKYFGEIFKDVDGKFSSKRTVVAVAVILLSAISIGNLIYGLKFELAILDTLKYIIMTGLGLTGSEKFTGRDQKDCTPPPPPKG